MKELKVELLNYLAEARCRNAAIPTIPELSEALGVSTAIVREQLEVARRMGIVEIKPGVGIQGRDFNLTQSLVMAMRYGVAVQPQLFEEYADVRRHLEMGYWYEAVTQLTQADTADLLDQVAQAFQKINQKPVLVPSEEHRIFHLTIFRHLKNPIVSSLLETYWDLYRDSSWIYSMDQGYLQEVWRQHEKIAKALEAREFEVGYNLMVAHMDLVQQVKKTERGQRFE